MTSYPHNVSEWMMQHICWINQVLDWLAHLCSAGVVGGRSSCGQMPSMQAKLSAKNDMRGTEATCEEQKRRMVQVILSWRMVTLEPTTESTREGLFEGVCSPCSLNAGG